MLLIALIAVLTWYSKKNPVRDVEPDSFINITQEQIDTIVVQRADKPELIFEKVDGNWLITSPVEGNVLPDKINLLMKFLNLQSRHQHKIEKEKQLERYELHEPQVSLFMNDQQFDFGSVNGFNKLRYVLHDGTVHSVKDITHHLLVMDAKAFLQTETSQ